MGFRKFGQADDQRIALDREDEEAMRHEAAVQWTEEDAEALKRETTEQ